MSDLFISKGMPFNLDDLIHRRVVETHRVEFKATWDEHIKQAVVRTVSAFANDLLNLNGGYIILGIEEENGRPVLPPRGLEEREIDRIQREIVGECKGRISPEYLPVLFVESFQEKFILIIWAPAGENRPYQAPKRQGAGRTYWVRSGPTTVEARDDLLRQLMELAAKIPFDDRRSLSGSVTDISTSLVMKFLADIRSHLASMELPSEEMFRKLRLVTPVNSYEVPRNVALLFFNEDPARFFRGACIEVVQFGDDAGGDLIEEKEFRGPLPDQIRSCLNYLEGFGGALLRKVSGQAEIERTVPYPYEAMEEAIVNAVYHRSYEEPPEPVKIYLYPDRMEITSYPGPVPGIQKKHLAQGRIPAVPARNRRIGELLKDLRLAEGRGTGIPKIQRKMLENGSPEAVFDFDESRTYFRAILPVHPRYQVLHALREAAHLWAVGEKENSTALLERAFTRQPSSGALAAQILEYAFALDKIRLAQTVFDTFQKQMTKSEASQPYLTMARLLIDRNEIGKAEEALGRIPPSRTISDTVEAAILKKRTRDFKGAHQLFTEAFSVNPDDPKIIHELAQTKIKLARQIWHRKELPVKKRLNKEAAELLRRAIQLSDDEVRTAWCWFDLASVLDWLRAPKSEVEAAFLKSRSLRPEEPLFKDKYESWKRKIGKKGTVQKPRNK